MAFRAAAGGACAVVPWEAFDPQMEREEEHFVGELITNAKFIPAVELPEVIVHTKIASIQPRASSNPSVRIVGPGAIRSTGHHIPLDLDEFQR